MVIACNRWSALTGAPMRIDQDLRIDFEMRPGPVMTVARRAKAVNAADIAQKQAATLQGCRVSRHRDQSIDNILFDAYFHAADLAQSGRGCRLHRETGAPGRIVNRWR